MLNFFSALATKRLFLLYLACILFYSLILRILINKSEQVYFSIKFERTKLSRISMCIEIKPANCSNVSDENKELLKNCENLNRFFRFIQDPTIEKSVRTVLEKANTLQLDKLFLFRPNFNFKEFYLNYDHFCVQYATEDDENGLVEILNRPRITVKIFLHTVPFLVLINNHLIEYTCRNFVRCEGLFVAAIKVEIKFLGWPFISNRLNYEQQKFDFDQEVPVTSKSICFNECVKREFPLSALFYPDSGRQFAFDSTINLSRTDLNSRIGECNRICNKRNCDYEKFIETGRMKVRSSNRISVDLGQMMSRYTAKPILNLFDLYTQLFGYFCLMFGTSLLSSLENLNRFLIWKFKILNERLLKSVFILTWTIILTALFSFLILIPDLLDGFSIVETTDQRKSLAGLSKTEQLHLYLCFPISRLLNESKFYFNQTAPIDFDELEYSEHLLENKTLRFVMKNTANLSDLVDQIYLDDQITQLNYSQSAMLVSKHSKCFEIGFVPDWHKSLNVGLKVNFAIVYLVEPRKRLTTKTKQHFTSSVYSPWLFEENSTDLCDDYPKQIDGGICHSKYECVDRCRLLEYVRMHHSLSPELMVHKEYLTKFGRLPFRRHLEDRSAAIHRNSPQLQSTLQEGMLAGGQ